LVLHWPFPTPFPHPMPGGPSLSILKVENKIG
jgi:hypothetical protein